MCVFYIDALSDPVLRREYVFHQLMESTPDQGLVNLLNDVSLSSLIASLLSVVPLSIPIPSIPGKRRL